MKKLVMEGTYKSFDAADHKINDEVGRKATIKLLENVYPSLRHINNPDKFGIDILTIDQTDTIIKAWDAEVRRGFWIGDIPFPSEYINCIERKDSLWAMDDKFRSRIPSEYKIHKNCKTYYVQLNNLCNRFVVIKGSVVLASPKVKWDNSKMKGEMVHRVHISEAFKIRLKI